MPNFLGFRWGTGYGSPESVTWSFSTTNFPSLTAQYPAYTLFGSPIEPVYRDVVRAAFSAWEAVAGIDLIEVADTAGSNIRIGNAFIDGSVAPGSSTILGQTYTARVGAEATISQVFFDIDAHDYGSFANLAIHEIGHALGLDHSPDVSSVMFESLRAAQVITTDDIFGMQNLYGAGAGVPFGSPNDDLLNSSEAPQTVRGLAGNDRVFGNGGDDIVYGNEGLDTLSGGAGNDTIYGGNGVSSALDGSDSIYGDAGSDTIYGNGGDDLIFGGTGPTDPTDAADRIFAGVGNDAIYGNGGDDEVFGNAGRDTIYGGGGNDLIYGGNGTSDTTDLADLILAGDGNDVVYGNAGDDNISGEGGNDTIFAGFGNDVINSGPGNDVLSGNAGGDVFVFQVNSGADTILDYSFADGDRIRLIDQTYGVSQSTVGQTVLNLSGGGNVTLSGIGQVNSDFFI